MKEEYAARFWQELGELEVPDYMFAFLCGMYWAQHEWAQPVPARATMNQYKAIVLAEHPHLLRFADHPSAGRGDIDSQNDSTITTHQ